MSKHTLEEFKGLTVTQLKEKLKEVDSVGFLSQLEQVELDGENRTTAIAAINERQGELIDQIAVDEGREPETGDDQENGKPLSDDLPKNLSKKEPLNDDGKLDPKEMPEPNTHGDIGHWPGHAPDNGDDHCKDHEQPLGEEENAGGLETKQTLDESFVGANMNLQDSQDIAYTGLTTEEIIEKVLELRLKVDKTLRLSQAHFRIDETPENSLFLAKAWLGKLLGCLNAKNPYEGEDKVEKPQDIPAKAEVANSSHFQMEARQFGLKNVLPSVIQLRKDIEEIAEEVSELFAISDSGDSYEAAICKVQAWVNLRESKFHYGEILSKLKV